MTQQFAWYPWAGFADAELSGNGPKAKDAFAPLRDESIGGTFILILADHFEGSDMWWTQPMLNEKSPRLWLHVAFLNSHVMKNHCDMLAGN